MGEIIAKLIVILVFVGLIVWFIVAAVLHHKEQKAKLSELDEQFESDPVAVNATIVDKRIDEGYVGGSKLPNYTALFILAFKTENGETKEFSVPEEIYCRCYKKQTGTLVTLNGNFFDFGDGE